MYKNRNEPKNRNETKNKGISCPYNMQNKEKKKSCRVKFISGQKKHHTELFQLVFNL